MIIVFPSMSNQQGFVDTISAHYYEDEYQDTQDGLEIPDYMMQDTWVTDLIGAYGGYETN